MMIRDILSGYQEAAPTTSTPISRATSRPPPDVKLADFMNYNVVFPGHQTAMANPFVAGDGLVKYDDDTPPTVDNYARDVVAFLSWAADPDARGAQAHGAAGDRLPAHHRGAARLRQAPHLEQRALTCHPGACPSDYPATPAGAQSSCSSGSRIVAVMTPGMTISLHRRERGRRHQQLVMLARMGPSRSLSARAAIHAGSAWNVAHFFSRSASNSQARK